MSAAEVDEAEAPEVYRLLGEWIGGLGGDPHRHALRLAAELWEYRLDLYRWDDPAGLLAERLAERLCQLYRLDPSVAVFDLGADLHECGIEARWIGEHYDRSWLEEVADDAA
jgi:hypothetical protein